MHRAKHVATRRFGNLALLLALAMVVSAFAVGPLAGAAPMGKSDVCHWDADAGTFHPININDNAYDKHLAHGDGWSTGPVPEQPGYEFGDDCTVDRGGVHAYTFGGARTWTTYNGNVDIVFDIWDSAPHGWMAWNSDGSDPWSGDVVSATSGASDVTFTVRADTGHPLVVGCDLTFNVDAFVAPGTLGNWIITNIVTSPGETCGALGGLQGGSFTAGAIIIEP